MRAAGINVHCEGEMSLSHENTSGLFFYVELWLLSFKNTLSFVACTRVRATNESV